MPTPTKGARLGGSPSHERLMLANLATSLFEHGRITTTEAKAKRLRPFAERLITKARRADLHNRREIMRVIRDKDVVHKLVEEIGPHFANRPGGYTRITRTMPRKGDNAPMAVIELVAEATATAEAEKARGTKFAKGRSKRPATPADRTPADTAAAGAADTAADTATADSTAAGAADTGAAAAEESSATDQAPDSAGGEAAPEEGSPPATSPGKGES